MEQSASSTMLQSSEVEMELDTPHLDSNRAANGFVDPRVLVDPRVESDQAPSSFSSPQLYRELSPPQSDVAEEAPKRKAAFLPTGCCYDDRMQLHANADFSANPHHPEDPRRIVAIMQEFKDAGLIYTGSTAELEILLKKSPNQWMWRIAARKATASEITTVHTQDHLEWVRALSKMSSSQLRDMAAEFDAGRKSLYVGNLSYEAALVSAGGAIETCMNVVAGTVKNAIAVIRPPGHHAEHDEAMGFCFFNNVPIAAEVCRKEFPDVCRKVLVLDWDVHHGNGIQNMFYTNPNVLYISIHVYQNGLFYPGKPDDEDIPDGGLENCGKGDGEGYNVNIGWPDQGVGDGEYMAAFQKIVMPIAQEFDPDLVIVSAGFDAAAGDELGGCYVTPACYAHMTYMLMSLAGGKVAVCLEGGYNLRAISRSALAVAKTLMGEPPERMQIPPLNKEAALTLDNVKRIHAAHWECMRPGVIPLPALQARGGTERLSDVMRSAETNALREKFEMMPIHIQRTGLTKTFENQVLASPGIRDAKRILLIMHDP